MNETQPRKSDQLSNTLPPDEILALDTRRALVRWLNSSNGDAMSFRDTDPPDFKDKVRSEVTKLKSCDPGGHILFQGIPREQRNTPLIEEILYWDIESMVPLDPKAAQAILGQYKKVEEMPPEVHKLNFPLLMFGFLLGHTTRVAVYSALLAQKANDVDPVLASIAGFWHDTGKLEKSQKTLVKIKGRYTDDQFERIKMHPFYGSVALRTLKNYKDGEYLPFDIDNFKEIHDAVLKHHVRPDEDSARSYPYGIPASTVSRLTKSVSIADAFDAMTTRHHDPKPLERREQLEHAHQEIKRYKGLQFDADLSEIFLKLGAKPKDI